MKIIALFLSLTIVFALSSAAQVKTPGPEIVKPAFDRSLQAVVVTTKGWESTTGIGRLMERKNTRSDWKQIGESFPVVVGRSGLAWDGSITDITPDNLKREGDGAAPAGMFPLTASFGAGVKPGTTKLPYTKFDEFTECVDDADSSFYNRIVNRMQVGNFDWKSSEKMLAVGEEYELGIFVAYNTYPVVKGHGSCIFLHVWKDAESPTSGCTAMSKSDLENILGWVEPAKTPYLIQMVEADYNRFRKTWKLPNFK